MDSGIPDLRRLLVGLFQEVSRLHPEHVTTSHVERLRSSENVLLVLSRMLTGMSKKIGVTDEAIKSIINKAAYDHGDPSFSTVDVNVGKVDGHNTDWEVMQRVDDCMGNLEMRSRIPSWFIDDLWPSALRRSAGGSKLTERERAIAMYVTSTARGER